MFLKGLLEAADTGHAIEGCIKTGFEPGSMAFQCLRRHKKMSRTDQAQGQSQMPSRPTSRWTLREASGSER